MVFEMKLTAIAQAHQYRDGTPDEVAVLQALAYTLPPNPIIVNIGAGDRAISTLAFLEAREDSIIFSIDVKVKANERIYLAKAGLPANRVIRVLGKSQEVGRHWPESMRPDMTYVDGDHTAEGVAGDIKIWLERTRVGGILAFHDYVDLEGKLTPAGVVIDRCMAGYEELARVDRVIAFRRKR